MNICLGCPSVEMYWFTISLYSFLTELNYTRVLKRYFDYTRINYIIIVYLSTYEPNKCVWVDTTFPDKYRHMENRSIL